MKFLLAFWLLAFPAYPHEPLSLRNCNPCSLRSERPDKWPGCIGTDSEGHLKFRNNVDGLRACVINLRIYREKRQLKTPRQIVNRITKNSGITIGSYRNYLYHVCYMLSIDSDDTIDFSDTRRLELLVRAIVGFECGKQLPDLDYAKVFPKNYEILERNR